ncbi:MAG: hypothetical protein E6Q40_04205 [Cupriavidus sp.]|nr:MAG: hypothetical protein E6Q40_04205 [Cupriavidus sp.]
MSLNLSSTSLRALISLTEKREKLLGELSAIEVKISSALDGTSVGSVKPSRRGGEVGNTRTAKPAKRGKRGAIKEMILAGLKEAGEAGIAVKHLAAKLAIKPQNIHVWLHTTGKKSGLVKALGKGVYRLEESLGLDTPKVEAPKPVVTAKVRKTIGTGKSRKNAKRKLSTSKSKLTAKK